MMIEIRGKAEFPVDTTMTKYSNYRNGRSSKADEQIK